MQARRTRHMSLVSKCSLLTSRGFTVCGRSSLEDRAVERIEMLHRLVKVLKSMSKTGEGEIFMLSYVHV